MLDGDAVGDRQVRDAQLVAQREVRDVDDDLGRDVARQRFDRDEKNSCSSTPPSLHARRLALDGAAGSRR